ncbi:M23/M56 family metallopeptidase [Arsukibacterium indicum]|uniref:Peptidoglycan DD-metalloendopeptidase family protein n=1 Tax=Arsukibacterium indicum TaxID=2848612 RepID=A0ABS6MJK7_9GAMM|nr:M23/M56 family metallopeptidase [Arsukibacterium indicum]MBV2129007.1 peptidoglycan DD-metalloendopeptidase family protein [Arsukibacterium indicum]
MALQLLLSLLLCSVWAVLLWWASQYLLKKISGLQQWPAFYWWLLGSCFLPLLPLPQVGQYFAIPSVLLHDTLYAVQSLAAQPAHPGLTEQPVALAWFWRGLLASVAMVSLWRLGRVIKQWRQLQQLISLTEPLAAASVLTPAQQTTYPQLEIRQTQAAVSPFIAGWRHMVLVVPTYIWQLPAEQRHLLIAHELVHLNRHDPQQLILLRLLVACCWFMPVLKRIEQAFVRSIELAVDQAVLASQPERAAVYGQTLLNSLKLSRPSRLPGLAAGFIHGSAGSTFYRQRLQQLFKGPQPLSDWQKWRIGVVFVGSAFLLQLSSVALGYNAPPQQWLLPLSQPVVSSFYAERHPIRQNRPHQGLDFVAASGVTVKASQQGRVLIADARSLNSRYGNVVLIDHGHGYQTLYAHLNEFSVTAGQSIDAGEPVGTVGTSGRVTGPHLHFEILHNGVQQDPASYLVLP